MNKKKIEKEKNVRHKWECVNNIVIREDYAVIIIDSKTYGRKEKSGTGTRR